MNPLRYLVYIIITGSIFTVFNCGMKEDTIGDRNKVVVVADSTLWLEVQDEIKASLSHIYYTPQPEPAFKILHKTPDQLGKLTRVPNLLMVATLQDEGKMKEYVNKILSASSLQRVRENKASLFSSRDAWARNQLLVVAIAKDKETLEQNLQENQQQLFDLFDEFVSQKIRDMLFKHLEKEKLSKELMKKYGWTMRIQADFHVVVDSADIQTVIMERFDPVRWITVYWQSSETPYTLTKEWMINKRNEIARKFYNDDYIYTDDTIKVQEKEVYFNDFPAIRLDGVWQNDNANKISGGPFRCYGFYDDQAQRIYFIDMAVFAPGERKMQYIRQVDAMAHTFRTAEESSP